MTDVVFVVYNDSFFLTEIQMMDLKTEIKTWVSYIGCIAVLVL